MFEATDDGHAPNCREISIEGRTLPEHISGPLWRFLSSLKVGDRILDAALEEAERVEDDDSACDDERISKGAA